VEEIKDTKEVEKEDTEEIEEKQPKKKKIYNFRENYRGLDMINDQIPQHQEMLKMTVRSIIGALAIGEKLSYKDIVMLPYAEFMDLLKQFAEATQLDYNESDFLLPKE